MAQEMIPGATSTTVPRICKMAMPKIVNDGNP